MLQEFPSTRASLLVRIKDPSDREGWQEFVAVYAPLIHRYLRRQALQDADAADVTQEILQSVARSPIDYDVERGRFRSWLLVVTRRALCRYREAPRSLLQGAGGTAMYYLLQSRQDDAEDTARWEQDWQQWILQSAAQRIQPEFQPATWQAFWRTAIAGESPHQVANDLNLSLGAVYIAKCRVLARLRREIERLERV